MHFFHLPSSIHSFHTAIRCYSQPRTDFLTRQDMRRLSPQNFLDKNDETVSAAHAKYRKMRDKWGILDCGDSYGCYTLTGCRLYSTDNSSSDGRGLKTGMSSFLFNLFIVNRKKKKNYQIPKKERFCFFSIGFFPFFFLFKEN